MTDAGLSLTSLTCLIGYALSTAAGLWWLDDHSNGAMIMQFVGGYIVGSYGGYMDGKD